MKRLLTACIALALLAPACAFAQDTFTGAWRMEPATLHETGKPLVVLLKNGAYECNCTPPIKVKADGEDHAVTGHPGFDTVAIKILDGHSIQQTDKKAGKVIHQGTFTVSADGKTASNKFMNYHNGTETFGGTVALNRKGLAEKGANAAAGTWVFDHFVDASGQSDDVYKVSGDDINYHTTGGASYTAKINGKAVPFTEDGKQDGTVAVKRMGKDSLRETYATDGKVTLTSTMTVAADGKSMKTTNHNFKTNSTTAWVDNKQ